MVNLRGSTVISVVVTVGFTAIIALVYLKPVKLEGDIAEMVKGLVNILGVAFGYVVNYHLGSSQGSKDKDAMVRDAMAKLADSVPASLPKPPGSA